MIFVVTKKQVRFVEGGKVRRVKRSALPASNPLHKPASPKLCLFCFSKPAKNGSQHCAGCEREIAASTAQLMGTK